MWSPAGAFQVYNYTFIHGVIFLLLVANLVIINQQDTAVLCLCLYTRFGFNSEKVGRWTEAIRVDTINLKGALACAR